jgi:hypothetical protein
MEVRPGKGVGIEFLPGDPRMDRQFHELLERLSAIAAPKSE